MAKYYIMCAFVQQEDFVLCAFVFLQYRGILCSDLSCRKSKTSPSRKISSFFHFPCESVTPNNQRVGGAENQDNFSLHQRILLSHTLLYRMAFRIFLDMKKYKKLTEYETKALKERAFRNHLPVFEILSKHQLEE